MTVLNPSKDIGLPKLGTKQQKNKKMSKKKKTLMSKNDVTFKKIVAWFEHTT